MGSLDGYSFCFEPGFLEEMPVSHMVRRTSTRNA
jgi:hypothetical protein